MPFVVNKPYFCWKMGDLDAKTTVEEKGSGAAKWKEEDNSLKFSRICRDWRADSWEKELEDKTCPAGSGIDMTEFVLVFEQKGATL